MKKKANVNDNVQTFNVNSDQYEFSRPQYPEQIFRFLSDICSNADSAWDCACGTGQVSKSLIHYFDTIKASDINANQIENAFQHKQIDYSVQDSEHTGYPSNSFDLVCVAQALHWFSSPEYFEEVHRVLKDDGVFACWGYSFFKISPQIDTLVDECIFKPIQPYWSEKNRLLWNNYSDIQFPFKAVSVPEIQMIQSWTISELIAYIKTWSACKRYFSETRTDLFTRFREKVSAVWNDNEKKSVVMDFTFYCGQKSN